MRRARKKIYDATDFLMVRSQFEEKCVKLLVLVGFLYTLYSKLYVFRRKRTSRKGMRELISVSRVNWILSDMVLRALRVSSG